MTLKAIDLRAGAGVLDHECASCGAERTIELDRASLSTRKGAVTVPTPGNLVVRVDGGKPQIVPFAAGIHAPSSVRDALANLSGAYVGLANDVVTLESATTGPASEIAIAPSAVARAIFASTDDEGATQQKRPELGIVQNDHVNEDAIALPTCSCGAQEFLIRTHDDVPERFVASHFERHRRAVNALAQHFIDHEWVHPQLRSGGAHAGRIRARAVPEPLAAGARREVRGPTISNSETES